MESGHYSRFPIVNFTTVINSTQNNISGISKMEQKIEQKNMMLLDT